MLSKNDLYLLKLTINFAKESINCSSNRFDEYIKNNLENETPSSLSWKLDELCDRLDDFKVKDIKDVSESDKTYEELNVSDNEENNKLKSSIVSILSQMIEDGELGLYKERDYTDEYIGISIDNGNKLITPRYSFCGPVRLR